MASEQYLVLARKYRPQTFEEVVGQAHITRTLQNALASGRIGHAFLFIGSRGIGKTTCARILAKALNCLEYEAPTPDPCCACDNCVSIAAGSNIDVIEIDGASNNSVEDVRQIREHVQLGPSRSRYKIYIIDEVHQLSGGAFNALLKTIEEPPAHAMFILATTEAHKVPATIISRCQRYDFRRVGQRAICELLTRILDEERIEYSNEAVQAIARAADGGIRDAESVLEQVISYSGDTISYQEVYDVLGLVDWRKLHELCDAIVAKDVATQLRIVEEVSVGGKDLPQFMQEILQYFRNLLVCKTAGPDELLGAPDEEASEMHRRAERFTLTELIRLVEQFSELFRRDFDAQLAPRIALESLLIRISKVSVEMSVDTILEKLVQMGAGGTGQPLLQPKAESPGHPAGQTAPAATPSAAPPSEAVPKDSPESSTPKGSRSANTKGKSEGARTSKRKPPEEDPPGPLPDAEAPAQPVEATQMRAELTSTNLRDVWQELQQAVQERSLNAGIWLASARPRAIEGDCLILGVGQDQSNARTQLDQPANRHVIESVLKDYTANIRRVQFVIGPTGNPSAVNADDPAPSRQTPAAEGAGVSADAAAKALQDKTVVQALEIFKGRIVDVKSRPGS